MTEVAGRLADSRIGALPVVDGGVLRGLITITDVLEAEMRDAMAKRRLVQGHVDVGAVPAFPMTSDAS